jgi:hypothetical protein
MLSNANKSNSFTGGTTGAVIVDGAEDLADLTDLIERVGAEEDPGADESDAFDEGRARVGGFVCSGCDDADLALLEAPPEPPPGTYGVSARNFPCS